MQVGLDVFQRPADPEWQLDEAAAGKVRRRLIALRPSPTRAADPPGLGYRGFTCTDPGDTWCCSRARSSAAPKCSRTLA